MTSDVRLKQFLRRFVINGPTHTHSTRSLVMKESDPHTTPSHILTSTKVAGEGISGFLYRAKGKYAWATAAFASNWSREGLEVKEGTVFNQWPYPNDVEMPKHIINKWSSAPGFTSAVRRFKVTRVSSHIGPGSHYPKGIHYQHRVWVSWGEDIHYTRDGVYYVGVWCLSDRLKPLARVGGIFVCSELLVHVTNRLMMASSEPVHNKSKKNLGDKGDVYQCKGYVWTDALDGLSTMEDEVTEPEPAKRQKVSHASKQKDMGDDMAAKINFLFDSSKTVLEKLSALGTGLDTKKPNTSMSCESQPNSDCEGEGGDGTSDDDEDDRVGGEDSKEGGANREKDNGGGEKEEEV